MSTPDIFATKFFDEARAGHIVWLGQIEGSVLAFSGQDGETMIPVWSSRELCVQFLEGATASGLTKPLEVDVQTLLGTLLTDVISANSEIGLNPGCEDSRTVVVSEEEFRKGLCQ